MSRDTDSRKHIIAINDDPAVLQLFDDLLSEEGYRVTVDNFGRQTTELLDSIREHQPDLVVMDFIIGGEPRGWQLLQATQMDRTIRDIPVVICTGAVKQVTELSAHLDSLGVHVVIKPFDIDNLLEVINKVWLSNESHTPELGTKARKEKDSGKAGRLAPT
jgi:CheY-like chemotaxis protein